MKKTIYLDKKKHRQGNFESKKRLKIIGNKEKTQRILSLKGVGDIPSVC